MPNLRSSLGTPDEAQQFVGQPEQVETGSTVCVTENRRFFE
jgi:hypothetical protein